MRAQEAALKKVTSSKLRRLLERNKTFNCAEIDVGDMVLFYKAQNKKSLPRRRGPAKVIEMDESGVTASFQSQPFKVARNCVRRRLKDSDLQEGDKPALTMLHDRGLGSVGGDMGLTPFLDGDMTKDGQLEAGEMTTESGGRSSDISAEPAKLGRSILSSSAGGFWSAIQLL